MTSAEGVEYAKYECARCGRLAPRNELKVLSKWMPVSRTAGGITSISQHRSGGSGSTDFINHASRTNYQRVHAFVCRRCPGRPRPFLAAFKFLFWLVVVLFGLIVLFFLTAIVFGPMINTGK